MAMNANAAMQVATLGETKDAIGLEELESSRVFEEEVGLNVSTISSEQSKRGVNVNQAMSAEIHPNRLEIPIHVLKDMPNPGDFAYEAYEWEQHADSLIQDSYGTKVAKVKFRREANGSIVVDEIVNNTNQFIRVLPPGAKATKVKINTIKEVPEYGAIIGNIKIEEIELKDGRVLEMFPENDLLARIKGTNRIVYFEQTKDSRSGKIVGRWQEKDSWALTNMEEAQKNGWITQDVVPREISLDTIGLKGGLSVTDIALIRRVNWSQIKNGGY